MGLGGKTLWLRLNGGVIKALPLAGLALAVFASFALLGHQPAFAHGTEEHKETGEVAAQNVRPAALPNLEDFPIKIGGPFALKDPEGRLHRDSDYRGRFMLVFFGYANCQGICPLGLRNMAEAHKLLGDAKEKVAPVFITVDPERDTPEALKDFVAKTNPSLIALTGSVAELEEARKGYRVETVSLGGGITGNEQFRHNTFIHLMGPDGKNLTIFPPILDPERLAEAIRGYIEAVEL
jgi:protein SCO1/2